MSQPSAKKQIIFKIISIKHLKPVYFTKTQQSQFKILKKQHIVINIKDKSKNSNKIDEAVNNICSKLKHYNYKRNGRNLQNRSTSCDLVTKKKDVINQRSLKKEHLLKNIKEYLKFAYRRVEEERKSLNLKFPDIKQKNVKNEIRQQSDVRVSSALDTEKSQNNKKDKIKGQNRYKRKAVTKRQSAIKPIMMNPQLISAWDHNQIIEDF